MRALRFAVAVATLTAALPLVPAHADFTTPRVSPNASVSQTVGTTELSVKYCRPGVKGRTIWGDLVPWDKPWRTGANEITDFTTTDDIMVEGQALPAGTYGIVTIPSADHWVVAFSKQKDMWGAFAYDPKNDQLRVTVKPEAAPHQEWMQFAFDDLTPSSCTLALRWEKVRVPVTITVDVNAKVLKDARAAVAGAKADDWRTPYRAANWANDAGVAPEDVATWSAKALKVQENFSTLALAAKLDWKAGRKDSAIARITKSIALGKADKNVEPQQIAPLEKLLAEWSGKK